MQQNARATAIVKGALNTEIVRLKRAGDAALKKSTTTVAQVYYEMANEYEAILRKLDSHDLLVTEWDPSIQTGSSTKPPPLSPSTVKNK